MHIANSPSGGIGSVSGGHLGGHVWGEGFSVVGVGEDVGVVGGVVVGVCGVCLLKILIPL